MRRVGTAGGMPAGPVVAGPVVADPVVAVAGTVLADAVFAECGSVQPVHTANVAPPGEIVRAGHGVVVPSPHGTNWLVLMISVVAGCAGVSVPESAGETLTTWFGSFATETDQVTVPPHACRVTTEPVTPGTTITVPPSGSTDSVPGGVGDGGGGGGGELDLVLVGVVGVGVGRGVLAVGAGLAVVGAGRGGVEFAGVGAGGAGVNAAACVGAGD
jgi:hypothetical protein